MSETVELYGRKYKVLATFPHTEAGTVEANVFMEQNPEASLLLIAGGKLYLADSKDLGKVTAKGRSVRA